MKPIEMAEVSEEFAECWRAAGRHLQRMAEGPGLVWLRAHLSPPFLEHLSFRTGNQLFFVHLQDVDGRLQTPGNRSGLLAVAEGCGGHPCMMPMKNIGAEWVPTERGWGLLDLRSGNPVWPPDLVTNELIEMTDWELQDFAVQVVREHLERGGNRLMSWNGDPRVNPSLWFVGPEGPEWVIVRAVRYPGKEAPVPENLEEIWNGCARVSSRGHFASVAFANPDDPFDAGAERNGNFLPIMRGEGAKISFRGLVALMIGEGGVVFAESRPQYPPATDGREEPQPLKYDHSRSDRYPVLPPRVVPIVRQATLITEAEDPFAGFINGVEALPSGQDPEIKIDLDALRDDLPQEEVDRLFGEDGSLDEYMVIEEFGLRYVIDEVWVRASLRGGRQFEITSQEILSSVFHDANQYEGIDQMVVMDPYLGIVCSVAGGQGGGFAIIDARDGHWVFSTSEFSIGEILWVPSHSLFLGLHAVSTYAWNEVYLVIVDLSGDIRWIDLYGHNYLGDEGPRDPWNDRRVQGEANDHQDHEEPALEPFMDDGSLHIRILNRWKFSVADLISVAVPFSP